MWRLSSCGVEHLILRTSKERFSGTLALGRFGEVDCYVYTPLAYFPGVLLPWEFPESTSLRRNNSGVSKHCELGQSPEWVSVKWVLTRFLRNLLNILM